MKKTLIALAAFAATSAAFAQSSVTLYGRLDTFYGNSTTKNAAGVTTGKTSGLQSSGRSGTRWGMRGSEDLGGGLKANFQLEQGFSIDTGEPSGTRQFHRASWVGLSGDFGAVQLGRYNVHTFNLIDSTDADGTSSFSTNADITINGVRADNAISYTTPSMGGLVAKVAMVNEKTSTTAKFNATDLTVEYGAGPLFVGFGFGQNKTTTGGLTTGKNDGFLLGGTYDLGVAKLFTNYISTKTNKHTAVTTTSTELNLGVNVPVGAATLVAGLGRDTVKVGSAGKVSATDWVIGANYSLSKRTDTYARVSKNGAAGGGKTNTFAVGLRHNF